MGGVWVARRDCFGFLRAKFKELIWAPSERKFSIIAAHNKHCNYCIITYKKSEFVTGFAFTSKYCS